MINSDRVLIMKIMGKRKYLWNEYLTCALICTNMLILQYISIGEGKSDGHR